MDSACRNSKCVNCKVVKNGIIYSANVVHHKAAWPLYVSGAREGITRVINTIQLGDAEKTDVFIDISFKQRKITDGGGGGRIQVKEIKSEGREIGRINHSVSF